MSTATEYLSDWSNQHTLMVMGRVSGLIERREFSAAVKYAKYMLTTLPPDEQEELLKVINTLSLVSGLHASFQSLRAGRLDLGFSEILATHVRLPRGCIIRGIAETVPIGDENNREVFGRTVPLWQGQEVGRLLILCDGGIGDILQFARYINAARPHCQHLTIAAPSHLISFLSKNLNADEFTHYDDIESSFSTSQIYDAHASIYIVPGALKIYNYGAVPYLTAEPAFHKEGRKQVGLCWKCSPGGAREGRAVDLSDFSAFGDMDGIDFHSLVPGEGAEWMQVYYPDDYEATARVVAGLDLIITVDTGVAHLCGAMGKPTWILIPDNPCWRWETHRTESKWYPTATLYRKHPNKTWESLVQRAAHHLTTWEQSAAPFHSAPHSSRTESQKLPE